MRFGTLGIQLKRFLTRGVRAFEVGLTGVPARSNLRARACWHCRLLLILPALRTLPSKTVFTFSLRSIPPMSSFFPLNANDDVRDATRSGFTLVKVLMISSAIPSLKYSFSGSLLMLTNASTAMLFSADETGGDSGAACASSKFARRCGFPNSDV